MRRYKVATSIGVSLSVKGLEGAWIIVLLTLILLDLMLVTLLFLLNVTLVVTLSLGLGLAVSFTLAVLYLSRRFGASGLGPWLGLRRMPRHLVRRRPVRSFVGGS